MNTTCLVGTINGPVKLTTSPSGRPLAEFDLIVKKAFSTVVNGRPQMDVRTDTIPIAAWGRLATYCKNRYGTNPKRVSITGSVSSHTVFSTNPDGSQTKMLCCQVIVDSISDA